MASAKRLRRLALVGGLLNLPFSHAFERLGVWLEPTIAHEHQMPEAPTLWALAVIAALTAFAGIGLAALVYLKRKIDAKEIERQAFADGLYIDSSYSWFMGGPGRRVFDWVGWFDTHVVDGAVNGTAVAVGLAGTQLRRLQSGRVRGYAMGIAVGAVLLVAYAVARMGF